MRRSVRVMGVLVAVLLVAACGGSGDGDAGADPDQREDASTAATDPPLDDSPFCQAIRALEALGSAPDSGGGTPAEVLAQNEEVTALVDDATASAPVDAPPEVQALFDDYLTLSAAIVAANGDTEAAFAALSAGQPELMARLSQPEAHRVAFTFFSERCGTAPPG